ncbi:MAG TPA: DUF92 domain-containing protein [Terriglobales bacterium]|nr:DUF92 domain-containing protein [Terriglobales bacterium]
MPHHILTGAALTLAFAVLARVLRGVTTAGAVAGAVFCFVLYIGAGPGAIVVLMLVFAFTWAATRLGYRRKQKLGTAERAGGRKASQICANLGVAGICAALHAAKPGDPALLVAMAAALSEAASDTVSSELGQASGDMPRLITTWERVPVGANGGVSIAGTVAGAIAALVLSVFCAALGIVRWKLSGIVAGAGVLGMLADSFLGATLERPGWLNNDAVNLLGTLIAALLAFFLAF